MRLPYARTLPRENRNRRSEKKTLGCHLHKNERLNSSASVNPRPASKLTGCLLIQTHASLSTFMAELFSSTVLTLFTRWIRTYRRRGPSMGRSHSTIKISLTWSDGVKTLCASALCGRQLNAAPKSTTTIILIESRSWYKNLARLEFTRLWTHTRMFSHE